MLRKKLDAFRTIEYGDAEEDVELENTWFRDLVNRKVRVLQKEKMLSYVKKKNLQRWNSRKYVVFSVGVRARGSLTLMNYQNVKTNTQTQVRKTAQENSERFQAAQKTISSNE